MVTAAPGEYLDFNILRSEAVSEDRIQPGTALKELTVMQKKKRKAVLSDLKKRINTRLDEKLKRRIVCATPPRYDEIFSSGIEWLNSSSEEPLDSKRIDSGKAELADVSNGYCRAILRCR